MIVTPEQAGAYWILGGGPRAVTAEAISQAYVESGFDTNAVSSAGYVGLWQDGQDQSLTDPLRNARAAVAKWRDGGGSFRKHWTNFQAAGTEAKRLAYMPRAEIAAARVKNLPTSSLTRKVNVRNAGLDIPNPGDLLPDGVPNPLDLLPDAPSGIPGIGDIVTPLTNIAEVIMGFFNTWLQLLKKLTDPDTYKDIGKIWLGLIMLTIGLRRIFTVKT